MPGGGGYARGLPDPLQLAEDMPPLLPLFALIRAAAVYIILYNLQPLR